jgi:CheY-like chemotaxis protein
MGFETIEASDGAEALELFQRHIHEIVLVILDLSMPNMDGITAFHELKKIKPDVRVLLSSGYNEKAVSEQFTQQKPDFFIQKPFLLKDLEAKIAMALS